MKRFRYLLIVLLFLLVGCSNNQDKQIANICLLGSDVNNDGYILVCDEKYNVLKEIKIGYPISAYYQNNIVYYSVLDSVYESVNIIDRTVGRTIEVDGYILCVFDNGNIMVDDGVSVFIENDQKVMIDSFDSSICDFIIYQNSFYLLDQNGLLRVFSISDGSLLSSKYISMGNGNTFTVIEDVLYIVNELGITKIENYDSSITYLFQLQADGVVDAYKDVVYLSIEQQEIPFKITIQDYTVELKMLTDPMYYSGIDYQLYFKKFYEKEYYCIYDFPNN